MAPILEKGKSFNAAEVIGEQSPLVVSPLLSSSHSLKSTHFCFA